MALKLSHKILFRRISNALSSRGRRRNWFVAYLGNLRRHKRDMRERRSSRLFGRPHRVQVRYRRWPKGGVYNRHRWPL